MLLGRDEHRRPLAILELLGHGRPWVQERTLALQYETYRSRDGPRGLISRRSFRATPAIWP